MPGYGAPCSSTTPRAADCRRYGIRRCSKNHLQHERFSPPPRSRLETNKPRSEKVGKGLPGILDRGQSPHPKPSARPLPQGSPDEASNYGTGQGSAVMVAASAPTISDNESRPVRSSVEARSFLISSTSPRPL